LKIHHTAGQQKREKHNFFESLTRDTSQVYEQILEMFGTFEEQVTLYEMCKFD
jgi:hypothetical protein